MGHFAAFYGYCRYSMRLGAAGVREFYFYYFYKKSSKFPDGNDPVSHDQAEIFGSMFFFSITEASKSRASQVRDRNRQRQTDRQQKSQSKQTNLNDTFTNEERSLIDVRRYIHYLLHSRFNMGKQPQRCLVLTVYRILHFCGRHMGSLSESINPLCTMVKTF